MANRIEDTPAGSAGGRRWIWSKWTEVLPSGCDRCRLKSHFAFPSFWFLPSTYHNQLGRLCLRRIPPHDRAGGRPAEATGSTVLPARQSRVLLDFWGGKDHGAQRSGPRPGNEGFALLGRTKTGQLSCAFPPSTGSYRPKVSESVVRSFPRWRCRCVASFDLRRAGKQRQQ